MKKHFLLALGIAGGFICYPRHEAGAGIPLAMGIRGGPDFYLEVRPDFIYLDDYGFAVSYGGPYDVIYYGDYYFIFRDGYWYRSQDYRGPWGRIRHSELPPPIGRHEWGDINRRRDIEYRNYDRGYWDNRFRSDREQWRDRGDGRRGPDFQQGPGGRPGQGGRPGPGSGQPGNGGQHSPGGQQGQGGWPGPGGGPDRDRHDGR
ncbi:MAG: hypothetical protein HGB00_02545 [Chlorobiaceae bacterium]|nr:hypothetical protein [Chlorobiaceae bacterium]